MSNSRSLSIVTEIISKFLSKLLKDEPNSKFCLDQWEEFKHILLAEEKNQFDGAFRYLANFDPSFEKTLEKGKDTFKQFSDVKKVPLLPLQAIDDNVHDYKKKKIQEISYNTNYTAIKENIDTGSHNEKFSTGQKTRRYQFKSTTTSPTKLRLSPNRKETITEIARESLNNPEIANLIKKYSRTKANSSNQINQLEAEIKDNIKNEIDLKDLSALDKIDISQIKKRSSSYKRLLEENSLKLVKDCSGGKPRLMRINLHRDY